MAYFRLEPFGADIDHAMIAEQTAIIASVNRDRRKRSRAYTREDFMPGIVTSTPAGVDEQAFKTKADAVFGALAKAAKPKKKEASNG
jgi:hypothetical protein